MAIDYSHVRPPLEVFALTDNMIRATGSIPYTSLTWSRRFTKPGQFELVVPSSVYDTSWRYVYCDDRPELGMVQKVEFSDTAHTSDGVDTVTLSGFFLEQMLNSVVFLDEQPETQLVETEPPKAVMQRISSMPTVYQDPVGDWYYTNLSGDVVKAETGEVMTDLTGLTEQEYTLGGRQIGNSDVQQANGGGYLYWSDDQHETINVIKYPGNTDTYDVLFEDDRGNAYFLFNGHQLWEAAGIVDVLPGSEPTYRPYAAKLRDWKNNVNGIRYKEVTVKGPWQRTDTMEPITEGDSVQIALKWAQRFLGNSIIYAEPDFDGIQKMVDPSFQYLGDLLYKTLNEVGASLRLEYSYLYNTCTLECYKGVDRTQEQTGNPWAVFSDTWGTIYDYSASEDTSNYKNTCLVLYDYDKPKSFDEDGMPSYGENKALVDTSAGTAWVTTSVYIPYSSKRGYQTQRLDGTEDEPDIETYLDLRDEKPSCDNQWSRETVDVESPYGDEQIEAAVEKLYSVEGDTGDNPGVRAIVDMESIYGAYEGDLETRGTGYLKENYGTVTNLDTGVVDTYGYLRDWDLGDLVEMDVSTVGLVKQARIVAVDEVYESGSSKISIEIGEEKLDTIKKAVLTAKGR